MSFRLRLYTTVAFVSFCAFAAEARAGQLFPPTNAGTCTTGTVLAWNATTGSVDCVPALTGITVQCPAGQVLVSFSGDGNGNNHETCVSLPTCGSNTSLSYINGAFACSPAVPACGANQVLTYNGSSYSCVQSGAPTCGVDQVLTFTGGSFTCVNVSEAVPTCAADQFLTYNGATYQCATAPQVQWPTCAANQILTSTSGGPACTSLPVAVPKIVANTAVSWRLESNGLWYSDSIATCPNGYIVTGGGGYCDASAANVALFSSRPDGPSAYTASCVTTGAGSANPNGGGATAYAYCVPPL